MKIKKVGILKEKHIKDLTMIPTLKENGIECICSDLARAMGIEYNQSNGYGAYWYDGVPSGDKKKIPMKYVNKNGGLTSSFSGKNPVGVRLAIPFNDIEDFKLSEMDNLVCEYPLYAISGMFGKTIDKLFESNSKLILKTGRVHDINNTLYDEYEVFGIRFIKMHNKTSQCVLTDGTLTEKDKPVYLRIDKIPFEVDENAQLIYSSIVLMVSDFDSQGREFKDSDLSTYLNGNFLKSINDELEHKKASFEFQEEEVNHNRYGFDFSPLTEEDIVEICLNSDIAVFMHGKTGTGKTERIVSLDNDLELVDFGCTNSDGFTGIVAKDFNSKELFLYEPYWYKSLCKKCKEHPELLHILFLEELTNAKNDVQKVAFEVTLNKTLTNAGFRLHLPPNAVVCAAGNEASESKSANTMSAPLFGRFAHVYIDTDSEEWLKWALKRKKEGRTLAYKKREKKDTIHPAIVDYIRANGDKVLRTPYNGVTPNADPRKWALASKALYECNNPNVLRAFVGEEITKDFIKFTQLNLITVEDILNDRYDIEKIPFDPSLRWHITICLSTVDDENVDKVRDFVGKLGKEYLALFDYEWSKDNEERIMKLYNQSNKQYIKRLVPNGNK